jgi:predicted ribosome quality control (RQC) complex YloA/Tae2 family protein
MNGFNLGKNREEKIDKFLDNLTWYFSTKAIGDSTARAAEKLNTSLKELNDNFKKADESSSNLARALNRLTFWGVLIAAIGVFVSLAQFLYNNHLWPFIQ